jgi:hypothetical protein
MHDAINLPEDVQRSQRLQRRVIRLLLQHDMPLFRGQFHLFFAQSTLPDLPLLQQYDRYIKLRVLSNELLEDILPRVRRQLSLHTDHLRQHEEAPTRGDIDWSRTIEHTWHRTPGQPPQQFATRLRQRSWNTPENILVVAILQAYRQEVQRAIGTLFEDEELNRQEQGALIRARELAERELGTPYARALTNEAQVADLPDLVRQVTTRLRPGASPYRDLIHWWQRFTQFQVGRSYDAHALTLASDRTDEKTDAWLYELWIALEFLHLFQEQEHVQDVVVATDLLQCLFIWQGRRLRFLYNRQLDTATSFEPAWEHAPASRPDYTIERETPLVIRHEETLIWREPPVVLDAKYYLEGSDPTRTHGPIKKLLGDMALLDTTTGVLFFPQLPEPEPGQQTTRIIRRDGQRYAATTQTQQVHLYHLDPSLPFQLIQQRLSAILNMATQHLPERPAPTCHGFWPDIDTLNASQNTPAEQTLLCPKPHIGPGIIDLVHVEHDCLKNPRLCHVIGQSIVPPIVLRATSEAQLAQQSQTLRERNTARLEEAEQCGDVERAERIREHIFSGVGRATEQFVDLFGNTQHIEGMFGWIFGDYWQRHERSLAETTRHALISGEYVWQNYQAVDLHDWAAPAIQYCRALEGELKRRLYQPCPEQYARILNSSGFTIGTVIFAYNGKGANQPAIWTIFRTLAIQSGSDPNELRQCIEWIEREQVKEKRNQLAHGGPITRETASVLREIVVGMPGKPGILHWLAEHLAPPRERI